VSSIVSVEVEQAVGPGVDFERDRLMGLVGVRARTGGIWLGFDRAALVASDDGHGGQTPVVVALPVSTYDGARLEVELTGGWRRPQGPILVARLRGGAAPVPALAGFAAGIEDGALWFGREEAELEARQAHQRHRERASHARIVGGRAWHAGAGLPPELARFATRHSKAEYQLTRLPSRFMRGLAGLLDDDERMLYWIERPMAGDLGLIQRLRRRTDRRAALLALTDRQLLWIVDHAQPDRYLSDWGVDVELVPVERLIEVGRVERGESVEIAITTPAGARVYALPAELDEEVRVMCDLLARFTPAAARGLPRRRYRLEPIPFEAEPAARFEQEEEARLRYEAAAARGDVSAFLFSPSRPGQRWSAALILRPTVVELHGRDRGRSLALGDVLAISLTLSPLAGRLSLGPGYGMSYPAPLADRAAAFVRVARRALANVVDDVARRS
jgi:hypothetical protein